MINKNKIERLFELHPIRPGKISEISEATASSSVAPSERVNFHIGNPVQDEKLTLYYLRTVLNLPSNGLEHEKFDPKSMLNELGWSSSSENKISLLYKLIKNSGPYSPRGGYNLKNPIPLIKKIHQWLVSDQDEPLLYDLGEKSGRRELIISSGGKQESLRILLHSLNRFLVNLPAKIFIADGIIPSYSNTFSSLDLSCFNSSETNTYELLIAYFKENKNIPVFLVAFEIFSEETRRNLRNLSYEAPLYFIEANDAPNHSSLAREAKLKNRVLRIISPAFLSENLKNFSVSFLIGSPDILKIFESVHFQLKGTPSSSEIELVQYFFENPAALERNNEYLFAKLDDENSDDRLLGGEGREDFGAINSIVRRIEDLSVSKLNKIISSAERIASKTKVSGLKNIPFSDHLLNFETSDVLDDFFANINNETWYDDTIKSFLIVFAKEHKEYSIENLRVVNGSSRTALGILGFHCGVEKIITCDFSWTYEHCFPESVFVPLKDNFELDVDGICAAAENSILADRNSKSKIAVVINNPHNASGKIFLEEDLKNLIVKILDKNIFVIDDLAYQNVLPKNSLTGPKTVKQLALELVTEGRLYKDQLNKIITIHSLSKTDSFAGARLAVAEISDADMSNKFDYHNGIIKPNIAAILTAYLFYRNNSERIKKFWLLRNQIFDAKMKSLEAATSEFPESRNHFKILIQRPQGSMYPRMVVDNLPKGLSLDWLSYGLAAQGIGLVPLSSFARTAKGYELGRKSFRLTLGGTDDPEILLRKTRRVLIDLNRLIAEEKAKYNKNTFYVKSVNKKTDSNSESAKLLWKRFEKGVRDYCYSNSSKIIKSLPNETDKNILSERFLGKYFGERLSVFEGLFCDRADVYRDFISRLNEEGNKKIKSRLEFEFYKDDMNSRGERFRNRTYDRTVHPTQLYSLDADIVFNSVADKIFMNELPGNGIISQFGNVLIEEYLGRNIAINSLKESDELVCDLRSIIAAENFATIHSDEFETPLLSFWGDWDGSTRPSGQGHRLVAAALLENVNEMAEIIKIILSIDKSVKIDPRLISAIHQLPNSIENFWDLLNKIIRLTNQLEKRYKSVLPFSVEPNMFRKIGMKLRVAQDPIIKLWQHNDRTEQKMIEMRNERKNKLEYYFRLNKELRKTLQGLIPFILKNSSHRELILKAGLYKDILKRFVLTPRIHQKLITAKDQFAIDTTVHNIIEINNLSGSFGNPGMVMALQVSMSTNPEALISLDKKFVSERERVVKNSDSVDLPKIWSVPLFEDIDNVDNVENYLDKIWDYSVQSRSVDQETKDRFAEIICEIFVAGSDLSQQVGQTNSALLYNKAKHKTIEWLAKKGLVENVRMKLGSGEPMQRQGGYYADFSSKPAFIVSEENSKRFAEYLEESTIKSTEFAISPLHGVFSGGDLRTLQSAISEKMRHIRIPKLAQLLFHLNKTQRYYHSELIRASETFIDTRLVYESKSLKELERLTIGKKDEIFEAFADLTRKNFQQIVYGSFDDVVGIHVISYFLSKATPILRDRPVERPTKTGGEDRGQKILERIASTIPLSKHGSLLRAISHNKAQTFMLGINQLTTGLFRAMNQFSQIDFVGGSGNLFLNERILPRLPVYEILHTIRIFQDCQLNYVQKFSDSFPAGITSFALLREDMDSLEIFLPSLQKELLRRHGIDVSEFFNGDEFIIELLPTLRPDLAVLLQPDLFNTDVRKIESGIENNIEKDWLNEFTKFLKLPVKISYWRDKIWTLLEEPVKNQVKSFVELAVALNRLSKDNDAKEIVLKSSSISAKKFEGSLAALLGGGVDDSMKQFLSAAVQYLTRLPAEQVEVPIDIVRALKEVERILRIEEHALNKNKQELLNFYLAQISRYVGDNG